MFHAARAVLFSFGVKERSHYAMTKFLMEKVEENSLKSLISVLDSYRMIRHSIHYRGEMCSREDATEAIEDARRMIELARKYLARKFRFKF